MAYLWCWLYAGMAKQNVKEELADDERQTLEFTTLYLSAKKVFSLDQSYNERDIVKIILPA